jgi:hypothetical protein
MVTRTLIGYPDASDSAHKHEHRVKIGDHSDRGPLAGSCHAPLTATNNPFGAPATGSHDERDPPRIETCAFYPASNGSPRPVPGSEHGGEGTLVRQSRLSGHDLRFGIGVHETTFRVNVRWVTPLGEETASTW